MVFRIWFYFLIVAIYLLFTPGCKKNNALVDQSPRMLFPVAATSMTVDNLFNSDNYYLDSNGVVVLRISEEIFNLELDTLGAVPDTFIGESFSIPFSTINLYPGFQLITEVNETTWDLGDVELAETRLDSGSVEMFVTSTIPEEVILTFSIPGALLNGYPLNIVITVPAGSPSSPSNVQNQYDVEGYVIDMTGQSGNKHNTISTSIIAEIAPDADTVQAGNQNYLTVTSNFKGLRALYGIGYLGSYNLNINEEVEINLPESYQSGEIDIKELYTKLKFTNHVGADVEANIISIGSSNSSSLQNSVLSTSLISDPIHINRGILSSTNPVWVLPSFYNLELNHNNSNIDELFEIIPDHLNLEIDVKVNPMGNISNYNDFIYQEEAISVNLEIDLPLKLAVDSLTFRDSIETSIEFTLPTTPDTLLYEYSGYVYLDVENGFVLDLIPQIFCLDSNKTLLYQFDFNNQFVSAASYDLSTAESVDVFSRLPIPIDNKLIHKLYLTKWLAVDLIVNNSDESCVIFYQEKEIKLNVIGDIYVKAK